jgi:hypothetical protein
MPATEVAGAPGAAYAGCWGSWYGRAAAGAFQDDAGAGAAGVGVPDWTGGVAEALGGAADTDPCFAILASTSMIFVPPPACCGAAGATGAFCWPAPGKPPGSPEADPLGGLPGGVVETSTSRVRSSILRRRGKRGPARPSVGYQEYSEAWVVRTIGGIFHLLPELLNVLGREGLRSLPDVNQLLDPILQGESW